MWIVSALLLLISGAALAQGFQPGLGGGGGSSLATPVSVANGGTGQTTQQAAIDALLPAEAAASGKFLTNNGSASSWGTVTSGVTTMAAVGASPSDNGASISSSTLTLQPADATHPGVATTGSQTLAGNKTLSGDTTSNSFTSTQAADNTHNGIVVPEGVKICTNGATCSKMIYSPATGGALTLWNSSGTSTVAALAGSSLYLQSYYGLQAGQQQTNQVNIHGSASTVAPDVTAAGGDSNINLSLVPKGTDSTVASQGYSCSGAHHCGTVTLSTGSGTATVRSGRRPICTDTTGANAVGCSVSSTTITVTGTGSDVIDYFCF